MEFGWINGINLTAVILLILINIVALKTGDAEGFSSKYRIINVLEQIGRYGCMFYGTSDLIKNWKFGFQSVGEMSLWIASTVILLLLYGFLWIKKRRGGISTLYGLAIIPVVLFLMNGVLLRHYSLIAASLLFGVCHFDDCSGKSELNIPAGSVQRCSFPK